MKKNMLVLTLLFAAGQTGCTPRMAAAAVIGATVGAAIVHAAGESDRCHDGCRAHHHHHYHHHHYDYDDAEYVIVTE